jgi:hypothetical protein
VLRSEYVLKVEGLESNDVLYAGDEKFRAAGLVFIRVMSESLITALKRY